MTELLEDEAHEAWTEKVLEKVPVRMRVFVEVANSDKAATAWLEQRGGFVVSLPNKTQIRQPAELFPVFREELLACFDEVKKTQLPERNAAGDAEDWEGVEVDRATTVKVEQKSARPKVEFLPDVASLPRPDQLLLKPPYHLSLIQGHQQIELHCSHSPTLKLLAEYLKRWCRVNHADSRNVWSCSDYTGVLKMLTFVLATRRPGDTPSVCFRAGRDV